MYIFYLFKKLKKTFYYITKFQFTYPQARNQATVFPQDQGFNAQAHSLLNADMQPFNGPGKYFLKYEKNLGS